jgi:hypothetical protein
MKLLDDIVKAAILGTDKYQPPDWSAIDPFPAKALADAAGRETAFLKLSAVAFWYAEAGSSGAEVPDTLPVCPPEPLPEVSPALANELAGALQAKDDVLLDFLVAQCNRRKWVVSGDLVPFLLDKSLEQKRKAPALMRACGQTGQWLAGLNPEWQPLIAPGAGTAPDWETGTLEQRKELLDQLRRTDPAAALSWLQKTIGEENAAVRAELLDILDTGLSLADEPFLAPFLADKSQKVKQIAAFLLKKMPGSALNLMYVDYALQCLVVEEEHYMLVRKKRTLAVNENVAPAEQLFKTGMEKVSNQKGVSDGLYYLAQALAYSPPAALAKGLGCPEGDLLDLLLAHPRHKVLLPYLVEATQYFGHVGWARRLLQDNDVAEVGLLALLPAREQVALASKVLRRDFARFAQWKFTSDYQELDEEAARAMLAYLETEPYQFNKNQYQQLALYLPVRLMPTLQQYAQAVTNDYRLQYFAKQNLEMLRMLEIKSLLKF